MNGEWSLATRHRAVLDRMAAAARAAGRDPASVTLLAVSKTFGAEAVAALAACGQQAFGENYLQEALDKQPAVSALIAAGASAAPSRAGPPLVWHFIGPIQSNKTRRIAEAFDWVHSVESLRIARRLSDQRPVDASPLQVLLQVNVSGEASKSGCAPDEAAAIACEIAALPRLQLRGLMTIPEPNPDGAVVAARFGALRAQLATIREALLAAGHGASRFNTLSMGMSGDLEVAIAQGATIVRIGSALFGERAPKPAAGNP